MVSRVHGVSIGVFSQLLTWKNLEKMAFQNGHRPEQDPIKAASMKSKVAQLKGRPLYPSSLRRRVGPRGKAQYRVDELSETLPFNDLVLLSLVGLRLILVHGGSP
ncbi:hypothetical protein SAY86_014164 [Trapa natans]|uniref:Uncharacterized protein n=1 Tax=Trapa natans TaxID=22666 RepID=A0AAN7KTN6_TRANT|nr:hypothetical protein SAY86_014164 [Trapa natans]